MVSALTAFLLFLFSVVQQPNWGLGRLVVEVYRSHTIRHTHTVGRTSLNERSDRRLHDTQQTQEKNMLALSGIRTRW